MKSVSILLILSILVTQCAGCAPPPTRRAGPPVGFIETDVERRVLVVFHDGTRVDGYLVRWDEKAIVLQIGQSNRIVPIADVKSLAVMERPGPARKVVTVLVYTAIAGSLLYAVYLVSLASALSSLN